MSRYSYLLETDLMKRTKTLNWGPKARPAPQFKLPMTGDADDFNAMLEAAGHKRSYGPRVNRDRWCDMAAKLPAWVQTGAYRLTEATKAVLYTILHDLPRTDNPDGGVSVAFGAIAAYAGVSEKTVERSVKTLEDAGLITVTRGGWSNRLNRKVVNVYTIADRRLRAWWSKFFGRTTDKYDDDPITSKIPVITARQSVWGEPTRAQTQAAELAAKALGENGNPWAVARDRLMRHRFRGMSDLVQNHRFNALLAALHLELRLERDPESVSSPRGFLRAILSKDPDAYHPFPSIRKEMTIRMANSGMSDAVLQ